MSWAITSDVSQCLVEAIDDFKGELVVHPLCAHRCLVGDNLNMPFHRGKQSRNVVGSVTVNEQTIKGVADADTSHLSICNDAFPFLQVTVFIEISMHDACPCLDNRHTSIVAYEVNEFPSASRDTEIHITNCAKQFGGSLESGWQQS